MAYGLFQAAFQYKNETPPYKQNVNENITITYNYFNNQSRYIDKSTLFYF